MIYLTSISWEKIQSDTSSNKESNSDTSSNKESSDDDYDNNFHFLKTFFIN